MPSDTADWLRARPRPSDQSVVVSYEGIIDSAPDVEVVEGTKSGSYYAVVPLVSGRDHFTGHHDFWFDPVDPLRVEPLLR